MRSSLQEKEKLVLTLAYAVAGRKTEDLPVPKTPEALETLLRSLAKMKQRQEPEFYFPKGLSALAARLARTGRPKSAHAVSLGAGTLVLEMLSTIRGLWIYGCDPKEFSVQLTRLRAEIAGFKDRIEVEKRDVLSKRVKGKFDLVFGNPAFSREWNAKKAARDPRFKHLPSMPSEKKADFAYIFHAASCLKDSGRALLVMPHGILHRRSEAVFRKILVKGELLEAVISFKANLFKDFRFPLIFLVLKRGSKGVFFMDLSKKLKGQAADFLFPEETVSEIVEIFSKKKEVPGLSKHVLSFDERTNLNVARHVWEPRKFDEKEYQKRLREFAELSEKEQSLWKELRPLLG